MWENDKWNENYKDKDNDEDDHNNNNDDDNGNYDDTDKLPTLPQPTLPSKATK